MLTCYDASFAAQRRSGVELLLVGDSLGIATRRRCR
jgi:ketopantoate hydroxymethyltransferase